MKKLFTVTALVVSLAALSLMAWVASAPAQVQIEDQGIAPNQTPSIFWTINQTGGSEGWTIDSAVTDTGAAYKVVPGLMYTISALCNSTADTVTQIYVYRNTIGSLVGAQLIDSTGVVGGTTRVWRDLHGGSAGLKYPVMARYLIFTAANDDGANAATVLDLKLISTVLP